MHDDSLIGNLYLNHIHDVNKSCELSIYLINDSVKNKGYGTFAEILALNYAFTVMNMETVTASVLTQNIRSRRVLEKAGFRLVNSDSIYHYYCCNSKDWCRKYGKIEMFDFLI